MDERITLTLAAAAFSGALLAQTATNTCDYNAGNQYAVNTSCVFQTFNKPNSFTATMNPANCNGSNNDDAFGWFTATGTMTAVTYDPDDNHRPIVHVFTGACGSLTQVACFSAAANGNNAELVFATTPGTDYMIRVQRHNTDNAMNGRICIWTPPAFDECAGAITLPVTPSCVMQTFSNMSATRSATTPNPTCGPGVTNLNTFDVWFRFTTPMSGNILIDTQAGSLNNGHMQLYAGTCNGLTTVQCNSDAGPGNMPRIDRRCDPLDPFTTYYIRFWGNNGQRGIFNICISGDDVFPTPQEDCVGGLTICSDQSFSNTTNYTGCTTDLNASNRGCLAGNERQGTWYYFSPATSGTIEFTITPVANIDFDYAIWGPMTQITCPPVGQPLRCSWAWPPAVPGYPGAAAYLTGLGNGAMDVSEGSSGTDVDGFTAPLPVQAGEIYVLYIDNYDITGQHFTFDWNLYDGCTLDCMILPVELVAFGAETRPDHVAITWSTQVENQTDHFIVERAGDDLQFTAIGQVQAAGYSIGLRDYHLDDRSPLQGTNYYRLRQTDLDGSVTYSQVASAMFHRVFHGITLRPNPARQRVQLDVEVPQDGAYLIQLIDARGSVLGQATHVITKGGNTLGIELEGFDSGAYMVRLLTPDGSPFAHGRFIKE
ncbi:MAG: T9SS type A sorting domain-containing protein [Flavobacteriales bacterium]|nr:T9SS type A sorting domain-containing protein [Flavobacteriales bacterium]